MEIKHYSVDGNHFSSFTQAVNLASRLNASVVEIETGIIRWHPPTPVSARRKAMYAERLAAYEASKRM